MIRYYYAGQRINLQIRIFWYNPMMVSVKKTLEQVLRGTADANISFSELCKLVLSLGFEERTKGSHHVFRKTDVVEQVNLQKDGAKAKPYQVRQVRKIILKYKLKGDKNG